MTTARPPASEAPPADTLPAGRSPWADARTRFLRNRAAVVSLVLLAAITLACVLGPMLLPNAYDATDWNLLGSPPTWQGWHLFGTDESGRDLLVRTLVGGRVSLVVGVLATALSVSLGVAWGATAGFVGGWVDAWMMRFVDMLYAIPYLLVAILLVTVFGRDLLLVVLAISAFSWLDMARVARGQTLSIKSREYIEAAHAIGVPTWRIVAQHVMPNLMGIVVIYASITVPGVILAESVLSFLGLGVQEPMTSWGVLVHDGANAMADKPWAILFPAAALSITLYCANFIGDGLRDALDPKDR